MTVTEEWSCKPSRIHPSRWWVKYAISIGGEFWAAEHCGCTADNEDEMRTCLEEIVPRCLRMKSVFLESKKFSASLQY
jgi:hypothetical protein